MHRVIWFALGVVLTAGCSTKLSSLLLERHARGPLLESPNVALPVERTLEPVTQTQTQGDVEVNVVYASQEYLKQFFSNRTVFGKFAGHNPYFPENLVFYVKITNRSAQRLQIKPSDFVLVDDRGSQYTPIGVDYVTALAESRQPVGTVTRGLLEDARPGYFGLSFPVGKVFAGKPQGRYALLTQAALQSGYLYPGVIHDGLVSFWSPSREATSVRLLVTNLKTDFAPDDLPRKSLEFAFTFQVVPPGGP